MGKKAYINALGFFGIHKNKLAYLRYTVHTICQAWFKNNKHHLQLKIGNNISLIPEPDALCMHGFAMFMTFSSLLIHPAGQRYDIQQLGASIRYTRQLQTWRQTVTIQKSSYKNIIPSFSTINHEITSKLKSLNYLFMF